MRNGLILTSHFICGNKCVIKIILNNVNMKKNINYLYIYGKIFKNR